MFRLLLKLSLFLIPFDSIVHVMPSSYRPIVIYILLIVLISLVCSRKLIFLNKAGRYILIFGVYSLTIPFLSGYYKLGTIGNYFDSFMTMLIGVMTFIVYYNEFYIYRLKASSTEEFVYIIYKYIAFGYQVAIVIGVLEMLSLMQVIPIQVSGLFKTVFGAITSTRASGTTREASWQSMHMLFCMPVFLYMYNYTKNKKYLWCLVFAMILFFFTGSLQGITILVACLGIYYFLISMIENKLLKFIKRLIAFIFFAIVILYLFIIFAQQLYDNNYVVVRLKYLTSISALVQNDGSSFVRIMYPVTSLIMWIKNPIFGVGPGNFGYYFKDLICTYFPWGLIHQNVAMDINRNEITTLFLYGKILCEYGIVSFVFFMLGLSNSFKGIKKIKNIKHYKAILLLASYAIGSVIQFGSLSYVQFWLILAFFSVLLKAQ